MDTNMTGFKRFSKIFAVFVLWTKVATALKGLILYTRLVGYGVCCAKRNGSVYVPSMLCGICILLLLLLLLS